MAKTEFIWDVVTGNVMMEKDGAGNTQAVYTQEPYQYGRLISKRRGGQTSYYHFDGNGNTRALTDSSQNVTDTYTYTAFGDDVATTGNTPNRYRFGGQYGYQHNEKTQDYYVRARPYKPQQGRWLSKDPLRFVDGLNPYVYVHNQPVNLADPSGAELIVQGSNKQASRVAHWLRHELGVRVKFYRLKCPPSPASRYYIVVNGDDIARVRRFVGSTAYGKWGVDRFGKALTSWEHAVYKSTTSWSTHIVVREDRPAGCGKWSKGSYSLCTLGRCGVDQMFRAMKRKGNNYSPTRAAKNRKQWLAQLAKCKGTVPQRKWSKAAEAIWTAAGYIVPGSEITTAVEALPHAAQIAIMGKLRAAWFKCVASTTKPKDDPKCDKLAAEYHSVAALLKTK